MSEILDNPTTLPIYPANPFNDEFKSKWYDRYKNGGCTKEQLQRLYNLDKLTKEDFKLITGELPSEKVIPQKGKVSELQYKISILEGENEKLKLEQEQQNEEILVNMLANTEMFEMLLGMIPMTLSKDKTKNNGGNSMIEVYVTLIIKGVKTIEDVPLVIREQVIERLKQLEVPVK